MDGKFQLHAQSSVTCWSLHHGHLTWWFFFPAITSLSYYYFQLVHCRGGCFVSLYIRRTYVYMRERVHSPHCELFTVSLSVPRSIMLHFDDKFVPNMARRPLQSRSCFRLPVPVLCWVCWGGFLRALPSFPAEGTLAHLVPSFLQCRSRLAASTKHFSKEAWFPVMKNECKDQELSGICPCDWGVTASRPFRRTGLGSRHTHTHNTQHEFLLVSLIPVQHTEPCLLPPFFLYLRFPVVGNLGWKT